MDIDFTDFTILRCIHHRDCPLWKKRIHDRCTEYLEGGVSVQTVGRRVDRLHRQGLLQSSIWSPDDIDRDLIIGYELSDAGRDALVRKRRDILLQAVRHELFGDKNGYRRQELLYELTSAEFGLDREDTPLEQYELEELLALVALHYSMEQAQTIFTEDNVGKLVELAEQNDEVADVLALDIFSPDEAVNENGNDTAATMG